MIASALVVSVLLLGGIARAMIEPQSETRQTTVTVSAVAGRPTDGARIPPASTEAVTSSPAAAAFIGGAVPTASITQAAASQDIVFVPYEEEAMERLSADYPFFSRATVPANTYRGQTTDLHMLDTGSMHLITSADNDEQLVYEVTKGGWRIPTLALELSESGLPGRSFIPVAEPGSTVRAHLDHTFPSRGVHPLERARDGDLGAGHREAPLTGH
jgi:hypothetical protein